MSVEFFFLINFHLIVRDFRLNQFYFYIYIYYVQYVNFCDFMKKCDFLPSTPPLS